MTRQEYQNYLRLLRMGMQTKVDMATKIFKDDDDHDYDMEDDIDMMQREMYTLADKQVRYCIEMIRYALPDVDLFNWIVKTINDIDANSPYGKLSFVDRLDILLDNANDFAYRLNHVVDEAEAIRIDNLKESFGYHTEYRVDCVDEDSCCVDYVEEDIYHVTF